MNPSLTLRLTATGDVTTRNAYLRNVVLLNGGAAATAVVRKGGSGGTIILELAQGGTAVQTVGSGNLHDTDCPGGIHVTLSGSGAEAYVTYAQA